MKSHFSRAEHIDVVFINQLVYLNLPRDEEISMHAIEVGVSSLLGSFRSVLAWFGGSLHVWPIIPGLRVKTSQAVRPNVLLSYLLVE